MEYQETINLLDKTPNQRAKFRTKNWVEINDDSSETSMLKSSLCDYSDAHMILKEL